MVFYNHSNFNSLDPFNFEHPVPGSKTVPDLTLTLRTLVERYTREQYVPTHSIGAVYDEDSDGPIMDNMDALERLDLLARTREQVAALQAEAQYQAAQAKAAKAPAPDPAPPPAPAQPPHE